MNKISSEKDYFIMGNILLKRKDNTLHYEKDDRKGVIPINGIDAIYILGHAELNNEVLNLCGLYSVPIHFFDYYENYTGSFIPKNSQNAAPFMLKQLNYYNTFEKRLRMAQNFIYGATQNIIKNIKYKLHNNDDTEIMLSSIEQLKLKLFDTKTINELMAIEGNIRKNYYEIVDKSMVLNGKEDFVMDKRIIRPPNNKMNSLISFGNTILYATTLSEIYKTQLNPSISFLHELQKTRYSLPLDISEVFKPIIVDRIILRLINLNMINDKCFDKIDTACFLNTKGKQIFLEEYNKKMEETLFINSLNKNVTYKYLIRLECYKIIKAITEDFKYKPFSSRK